MNNLEIIDFSKFEYKDLCEELRSIISFEKEVKAKKESLREKLIEMANGDRMEYGVRVQWKEAKGSVDMKKIQKTYSISDEELETYRKEPRGFWDVRNY